MDELEELIELIKQKEELSNISNEVIKDEVIKHLKGINKKSLSSKEKRVIMKEVRASLRRLVGRFTFKHKNNSSNCEDLLKEHASTKERIDYYPLIKKRISSLNVSSILDIGCGLNPLAIAESKYNYYALDIME